MKKESLKLVRFQVQGARVISDLTLDFKEQGLDEILGKNRQGKSTVIDCISILLGGKRYYKDKMIEEGQKKMVLVGQLSDGTQIKRIFTENSDRLEVSRDNAVLKSPQLFLDNLISEFTLNPYPFLSKTPKEKVKFMMDFCGLDFEEVNKEIKELEQERVIVGREVKGFGDLLLPKRVVFVDIDDLYLEKNKIEIENNKTMKTLEAVKEREYKLKSLEENKRNVEGQIESLRKELKVMTIDLPVLLPVEEIETKIKEIVINNQKAQEYDYQKQRMELKKEKEDEYRKVQEKLKELQRQKTEKLIQANIPVRGLTIQEDNLYLKNGEALVSSENWSNSERLLISLELCKAKTPKLRGIYYDEGEKFDKETREFLDGWAIENDINIVITRVDDMDRLEEGKIYIQEGKIIEGGGEMNVRRGTRSRQS